jgi:hypothetical protein
MQQPKALCLIGLRSRDLSVCFLRSSSRMPLLLHDKLAILKNWSIVNGDRGVLDHKVPVN